MSTVLAGPAVVQRRGRWRVGWQWGAAAGIVVVSFLLRVWLLNHGRGFASSDSYDDGVYYAAAASLVHGRLPYHDFLLLHPPGIVLALAPFAAAGSFLGDHVAVGLARIVFISIGAANTGLVVALGRRYSWAAGLLAGLVAAVSFPLAYGERSTLLEPLGNLLILTATLLIVRPGGRRMLLLAGGLVGAAVMVKIWYVVPAVILAVFLRRRAVGFLAAAAAAALLVAGPFLIADPAAMVREVLLDQLGRPHSAGTQLVRRLVQIAADPFAGSALTGGRAAKAITGVLVLVWLAAAVAAFRVKVARLFVVQAVAAVLVLLVSPSFFLHYATFALPWLAVVLGVGVAAAADLLTGSTARTVLVAVIAVGVVAVNVPADRVAHATAQPVLPLRALLADRAGCVMSDDPGLLANLDVLTRNLDRHCPLWPDVTGWTYDRDGSAAGSRRVPRRQNVVWQRDVMSYLLSGSEVILARSSTGLSTASRRQISALPVLAHAGGLTVHATG